MIEYKLGDKVRVKTNVLDLLNEVGIVEEMFQHYGKINIRFNEKMTAQIGWDDIEPVEIICSYPGCQKSNDFGKPICWCCGNQLNQQVVQ
jgi:hypothetical protein